MTVRNNYADTVHPFDTCGAGIDSLDATQVAVDLQQIADSDRPLPHQNPAADEVIDDILRAKANADSDCAGNEGERA